LNQKLVKAPYPAYDAGVALNCWRAHLNAIMHGVIEILPFSVYSVCSVVKKVSGSASKLHGFYELPSGFVK
jgi:hypothetical protein